MAPRMTEEMGVAEAKRRFSELIERVRRGERFLVTRRGKPVLALVPPESAETPARDRAPAGLLAIVGAIEDWDHEWFMREVYAARRRSRDRPMPYFDDLDLEDRS